MQSNNTSKASNEGVDTTSLVSIIMPMYNSEAFVASSVKLVLEQTYTNWELIIVDDCSSDKSFEAVQKFTEEEARIHLYKLKQNSGAAFARNYAIEKAQGEYIAFLDSDDEWFPDKLERQIAFMKEKKSVLSFTGYQFMSEEGELLDTTVSVPAKVTYGQLLKQNVIGCLTAMYHSGDIGKFYFDTTLVKHEDYQYWLEMLKKVSHADGLNQKLARYRIRQNSLSSNKIHAAVYVWKILRDYQKLPVFKAMYFFGFYVLKSMIKYYGKKKGL